LSLAGAFSCKSDSESGPPDDAIVIGALLPFSGEQAAVGFNAEQAVSLAIRDVNAAGGVDGHSLHLVSRDSNSGSDAGYEQAKNLIYDQKIIYLIGPEENSLAKKLVPDVKKLDILNILPGFSAPVIRYTGNNGAWLRLAPHPKEVGCAMALHAFASGFGTSAAIVASDDYQSALATEFNTYFGSIRKSLGTITVNSSAGKYDKQLEALMDLDPEVALLLAYPTTASTIMQEWSAIGNKRTHWYFPPTLFTEMFLQNVPVDALYSDTVFSPTGSLKDECQTEGDVDTDTDETDTGGVSTEEVDAGDADAGDVNTGGDVREEFLNAQYNKCRQDNFDEFSSHFTEFGGNDGPLLASLFYYDAVVLLALGLTAAAADSQPNPTPTELRTYIRRIAETPGKTVSWRHIADGLKWASQGQDITYSGAAAQYQFDIRRGGASYGLAQHRLIDIWTIEDFNFRYSSTVSVNCSLLDEI
jgi:ABC-type branched-subunit amino acid transport system substrate-binding protein